MTKFTITSLILLLWLPHAAFSQSENTKTLKQSPIPLKTYPYKNSVIHHYKGDTYLYFGNTESTAKDDYGPKFLMLKKENGAYRTLYKSKDSGDSYILKPSF